MSTSRPALRRASLAVTSLAAVPMLAFGSWYAASPRLTLNAMQGAALSGDVGGFSDHVDYPALRQSLKSELRARITAEVDAAPRNSLKALGLAMAIGFVDPLVDNSISPEAVGLVIASLGQGNPLAGSPALESLSLLATPDLTLQLGDSLTVVGEAQAIEGVEKILGNAVKQLDEPNLIPVFIGLLLGLLLGSIPFAVPGISLPVKLGLAGGPIILGILIGTFGPRIHIVTYTTLSANLMLRALGLSLYLACLGLEAGAHFVETIMRPEGMLWIGLGFLLTFVPIVIVAALSLRFFKLDFGQVAGIMCGSMANPMALNYANDSIPGDHPAVAYATVYPVCMFLRVIIIQILIMCFI